MNAINGLRDGEGVGMKIKLLVLASLAAVGAHASNWVALPNDQDIFIDVSRVHRVDGVVHLWWKNVYSPQSQKGFGANSSKWATHAVAESAFNCTNETTQAEAMTMYFEDGTSDVFAPAGLPVGWQPVAPDTKAEALMKIACSSKS